MEYNQQDKKWLRVAIHLAKQGRFLVSPNPPVGAVLVSKKGQVLAKNYHRRSGEYHAERLVLLAAMQQYSQAEIQNATLYITLEPCCSKGKTPACTDIIISSGVSRVVYGCDDPDPRHRGSAIRYLRQHNITVVAGVEEEKCRKLIRFFTHRVTTGLPWVFAKMALTLDGRIAANHSQQKAISNQKSRSLIAHLRAEADAIIIGGNTLRNDNPRLTLRHPKYQYTRQPKRIVLSRQLQPANLSQYHLFNDANCHSSQYHYNIDYFTLLQNLAKQGCNAVLLEGGGSLLSSFLEQKLVHSLFFFYAPIILSGKNNFAGTGLSQAINLQPKQTKYIPIESDLYVKSLLS